MVANTRRAMLALGGFLDVNNGGITKGYILSRERERDIGRDKEWRRRRTHVWFGFSVAILSSLSSSSSSSSSSMAQLCLICYQILEIDLCLILSMFPWNNRCSCHHVNGVPSLPHLCIMNWILKDYWFLKPKLLSHQYCPRPTQNIWNYINFDLTALKLSSLYD